MPDDDSAGVHALMCELLQICDRASLAEAALDADLEAKGLQAWEAAVSVVEAHAGGQSQGSDASASHRSASDLIAENLFRALEKHTGSEVAFETLIDESAEGFEAFDDLLVSTRHNRHTCTVSLFHC